MFVGHYGPSFAAKALKPAIPLWLLFIAVQLIDIFWAIFVLLGIEKVRVEPGITATNPLDLYYMPYTHSLLGSMLWSTGALIAFRAIVKSGGWATAGIVGAATFSHWLLDLLVHRPDLPLYDDTLKVGLGLWNFPAAAFGLEIALLIGGMILYLKGSRSVARGGGSSFWIFAVVMVFVQASAFFGPPPPSGGTAAAMMLFSYIVFAAVAYWLDGKRAWL
ncbi:MAG TPA: hypothetical protein VFG95_05560 [Nitrospiria bacterium]|nr:hypothetical protein [Nitrospiria bacterium]